MGDTAAWQSYDWSAEVSGEASAREAKQAKRALARKAREAGAAAAGSGAAPTKNARAHAAAQEDQPDGELFKQNPNANATFGNNKLKRKAFDGNKEASGGGFGAIMKAKKAAEKVKEKKVPAGAEVYADADANGDATPGKVMARRRRAAEKRARAAETRREARAAKGLPVDKPKPTLPAKQVVAAEVEKNRLKQIALASERRRRERDGAAAGETVKDVLSRHQKKRQASRQAVQGER
jgi:hypothetical protein